MNNTDQISALLSIILVIMIVVLIFLVIAYIVILLKTKNKTEKIKKEKTEKFSETKENNSISYNKQSVFSFMNFDKIEDNMIVTHKGNKYLMIMECQGINYDLMSGLEKNSVEQGFIQCLNTLRYPIQIFVQTGTVNLEKGIQKYRDKVKKIQERLLKKQMEYNKAKGLDYPEEEVKKLELEVARERNLYEYSIDIVNDTERMSLNKNILKKNYYIILSYTPEEINGNFTRDEISNMAFAELYTRCQSLISALSVCSITSKILDSEELAELLYVSYNRDESEIFSLEKALEAGYDQLYRTAPNVLDKRMKEIDKAIKEGATQKANELIYEATIETEKERQVKRREKQMDKLINDMARIIIDENESLIGSKVAEKAKNKLKKETEKNKTKKKTTKEKEVANEKK